MGELSWKAEFFGNGRDRVGRFFCAVRHPSTAAVALVLSGCMSAQTTPYPVDSNGLYSGEPVALHATEIPVTSAEEARMRAQVALAERDIDLALYFYVRAADLDLADAESFYAIGAIHAQRGNTDLAARAYARVVELDTSHALAHQGLGMALFDAQQFSAAEENLSAAVDLDESLWRAHNTLGILADRDKRYDVAIEHYTVAIQFQPTLAPIRNNRGYSKYLAGDHEAAKVDFLAALRIDTRYERAWRNLGLIYAREQEYERAMEAMTNAMEDYVALNDIGYVAMLDGDYGVAGVYLERAIVESPRHYQTAQDNLVELNRRRSSPITDAPMPDDLEFEVARVDLVEEFEAQ